MVRNIAPVGPKLRCRICEHVGSNKRLMLVHFERKHKYDCDAWARETIKNMSLGAPQWLTHDCCGAAGSRPPLACKSKEGFVRVLHEASHGHWGPFWGVHPTRWHKGRCVEGRLANTTCLSARHSTTSSVQRPQGAGVIRLAVGVLRRPLLKPQAKYAGASARHPSPHAKEGRQSKGILACNSAVLKLLDLPSKASSPASAYPEASEASLRCWTRSLRCVSSQRQMIHAKATRCAYALSLHPPYCALEESRCDVSCC